MKEGWQDWVKLALAALVGFLGFVGMDMLKREGVNSATDVRLTALERRLSSIEVSFSTTASDMAALRSKADHMSLMMQQLGTDMQNRTAALTSIKDAVAEIHKMNEAANASFNTSLREVSVLVGQLGKVVCSQQQCDRLEDQVRQKDRR